MLNDQEALVAFVLVLAWLACIAAPGACKRFAAWLVRTSFGGHF